MSSPENAEFTKGRRTQSSAFVHDAGAQETVAASVFFLCLLSRPPTLRFKIYTAPEFTLTLHALAPLFKILTLPEALEAASVGSCQGPIKPSGY